FTTRTRFVDEALPQLSIVTAPANDTEVAAQQARCDVESHHRGFDDERARAAHRIDELARLRDCRPATAQQHRRRKIFLQRRSDAACAISATMQAVAGEIEAERRALAI